MNLFLSQLAGGRWEAALVAARSLQEFGPQWIQWRRHEAFVVDGVDYIEAKLRNGRG